MKILLILDSESYVHPPVMIGKMLAEASLAELHALVVVNKGGHLENGEAVAEQIQRDLDPIKTTVTIKEGASGEVIKEALREDEYQLVVVNAERILRLRKTIDVDPILIRQSEISLLITQNTKPKIKRILLCTGCKENDYTLLEQAVGLASQIGSSITLLHVCAGSVPSMYTGLDQIDETVEEMLQTDSAFAQYLRKGVEILEKNQVEAEVKIRRGIPLEEIIRETQVENYDLVVIGSTKANQGLKEMLMGNLAIKIIDQVELPVLVVGTRELEP